jgi:hypothetical protein
VQARQQRETRDGVAEAAASEERAVCRVVRQHEECARREPAERPARDEERPIVRRDDDCDGHRVERDVAREVCEPFHTGFA